MMEPVVAKKEPMTVEVKGGSEVWWCRCGRSKKQPFCDGSHKGTGLEPMPFKPLNDIKVRFCACKHTKKPPFCDGSHMDL